MLEHRQVLLTVDRLTLTRSPLSKAEPSSC